jgi:NADH-quinone oxidoreductase subunit G
MPKLTINGQTYEAEKGKNIIQMADDVGILIPRYCYHPKTRRLKAFSLGPLVKLDQERCILCTRCVRFTRNVTKTNEIQVFSRGHKAEIGVFEERPMDNPYSGNVVDVCPVGALTSSDFRFKVRVFSTRSTGGGIPGYTATDGKIYRTVGRRNVEVNKSWLCDEGRLSFHTLER